jgi:hypothetical protein
LHLMLWTEDPGALTMGWVPAWPTQQWLHPLVVLLLSHLPAVTRPWPALLLRRRQVCGQPGSHAAEAGQAAGDGRGSCRWCVHRVALWRECSWRV